MRSMTQQELDYLEAGEIRPCFLVEINVSPVIRITSNPYPLAWQGNTYLATGQIRGIDKRKRTNTLTNRTSKIAFGSIDQSLAPVLFDANAQNRELTVWIGFLDANGALQFAHVWERLQIDGAQDTENPEDAELVINLSSWLAAFMSTAGIVTNLKSHQRYHPQDMFFEFAGDAKKEVFWGRTAPQPAITTTGGGGNGGGGTNEFPDPDYP